MIRRSANSSVCSPQISRSAAPTPSLVWGALPLAYVTDFVDFKIWPVWNIADLCVVSGVAILAWTLWREERAAMSKQALTNDQ